MKLNTLSIAILLAAALCLPLALSAHVKSHDCERHEGKGCDFFRGKNVSLDFEDGRVVAMNDDNDETVEITEKGDVFVNDHELNLNPSQRDLASDYYSTFEGIIVDAKEIGLQGAKVGAKGAALGLKAALGALLLLSPDYDEEDLEKSLEEKENKIEHEARKLEKRANRLEHKAEKFERLHNELRDRIEELDDLGWF